MNITAIATETPGKRYLSVSCKPKYKMWNLIIGIMAICVGIVSISKLFIDLEFGNLPDIWDILSAILFVPVGLLYLVHSTFSIWETRDMEKDLKSEGLFVIQTLPRDD